MFGSFGPHSWLAALAIALLFVSALVLAARKVSHNVWVLAALLILASLSLPVSSFVHIFPASTASSAFLDAFHSVVHCGLAPYSGFNAYREWQNAGVMEDGELRRSVSTPEGLPWPPWSWAHFFSVRYFTTSIGSRLGQLRCFDRILFVAYPGRSSAFLRRHVVHHAIGQGKVAGFFTRCSSWP